MAVPQNLRNDPGLLLGKQFFAAQAILMDRPQITPDEESFLRLFSIYKNLGLGSPLICLSFLADNLAYIPAASTVGNFLSYFAFVYKVDNQNLDAELAPVAPFLNDPMVDHWWLEGPMELCAPRPLPGTPLVNAYYTSLDFRHFGSRGKNVSIVDAEDFGDKLSKHPYLSDRIRRETLVANERVSSNKAHFYNTVGMLFAVPPATPATSPPPDQIMGIVHNASLVAFAFDNASAFSSVSLIKEFMPNFISRTLTPGINKLLTQQKLKPGDVLLFERMVPIPVGNNTSWTMPLEVLPDMRDAMLTCRRNGIVVIQPAGQGNGVGFNVDEALTKLSSRRNPRYTDFTVPVALGHNEVWQGSVSIMIGALAANGTVKPDANSGSIVDVYLWGEGIKTITYSDHPENTATLFANYGYTSAASSIAAGIVAALQSEAITLPGGKPMTTAQFKVVFRKMFRQGGASIFTSHSLKDLWRACRDVLSGSTL